MTNPLLDMNFLRELDLNSNKVVYAKIILLTLDEYPIEEIQGRITQGSINIDGASAVRRTCSLTMVSPQVNINNTYWALKNKFKLEIGIENNINSDYPDIIWFKQGVFVFTSLNMSVQSNNFTINLSGKDKMCLLNGEVGGSINASTDFGKLEEYENLYLPIDVLLAEDYIKNKYYYFDTQTNDYLLDTNEEITEGREYYNLEIIRNIIDIPIIDIIKNAVHLYAHEPLHNIILNDIDNYGLELLEYRGDIPLYLPRQTDTGEVTNMVINENQKYYKSQGDYSDDNSILVKDIRPYYNRIEISSKETPMNVYNDQGQEFNIIEIKYGETVGYRKTELTYPGELVANVGESLVTILDKIKNMFSDFEYFYDIDGKFIFQKKKTYVNTSWNPIKEDGEDELYVDTSVDTSSTIYSFENGVLLTAFTNTPNILDIKNDFSIWGKRKGVGGTEIPVHMRYAIDKKPVYYKPLMFNEKGEQIIDEKINKPFIASKDCDWRELIYQMALDYFKYNHIYSNFTQLIAKANPDYYPSGITGYENYYTDLQGFWRQLYNPEAIYPEGYKEIGNISEEEFKTNQYYIKNGTEYQIATQYKEDINYFTNWVELDIIKGVSTGRFRTKDGFNENVSKYPETLNFWFDFMSIEGEMEKYSVSAIGNRPKAINDDKVTAIYFQEVPSILFLTKEEEEELVKTSELTGYTYIQITPQMENYFTISAQGKSAKDQLDSLLYQHLQASESVTLTSIPIYHLQPNTRILIRDDNTGIDGEYIVSKISIPLTYNGTSSITTTKAVDRIY